MNSIAPPAPLVRLTGALYLLIIALPVLSLATIDPLIREGATAIATLETLRAHATALRASIVLDTIMYSAVFALAVAQFRIAGPHTPGVAVLGLVARSVEATLGLVTVTLAICVSVLVRSNVPFDDGTIAALVTTLVRWRAATMDVVLVALGLGALAFVPGFLRANVAPRKLVLFGAGCYALIALAAFATMLAPSMRDKLVVVFVPGTLFEFAIGAWLLRAAPSAPR
ncbi:MAG: DUF4386 domain-containing protein [Myxococcales bacterium]|nr:DUF4386 domain-containing protein [Myxococcales bacterium]